jgi:hypothetical protein
MTMKRNLGQNPRSIAIRLTERVCESVDRPCDAVHQQEVTLDMGSLSVMNKKE